MDADKRFRHLRPSAFCGHFLWGNLTGYFSMTKLNHPILFLATANAARSRAFYERLPGLRFVADEPPALVFQVGDSMLRIQKVDRVRAAPYTALGWAVSDIRRTVRDLREAGVAFERYEGMEQD